MEPKAPFLTSKAPISSDAVCVQRAQGSVENKSAFCRVSQEFRSPTLSRLRSAFVCIRFMHMFNKVTYIRICIHIYI